MKIFRFFAPSLTAAPGPCAVGQGVVTIPDTALLIQKRPFFIPDFAQKCTAQLCVVVRISRLGRSIHRRFAPRYYDAKAVTLGVHFVAEDLLRALQEKGLPWDMAVGFDNAVAVADAGQSLLTEGSEAQLKVNEATCKTHIPEGFFARADEQIERISLHYTLRQGDLLLLPLPAEAREVHIDNRLGLWLDGVEQLSFNVK